jgi:hypothetical protein
MNAKTYGSARLTLAAIKDFWAQYAKRERMSAVQIAKGKQVIADDPERWVEGSMSDLRDRVRVYRNPPKSRARLRPVKRKAKIIIGCPADKVKRKPQRKNPPRRPASVRNALMGMALAEGVPFAQAAKQVARVMTAANKLQSGQTITVTVGAKRATIKARKS